MGSKLDTFFNPLIKRPYFGAIAIVLLFHGLGFLFYLAGGRHYFEELSDSLHRSPVSSSLLLLFQLLPPFILLLVSKRMFTLTSKSMSIRINEGINQVKETQNVSVMGFTRLAEARDPDTGDHIIRMAHYSKLIAEHLSQKKRYERYITPNYVEELYISAPLHDLGKVGIKDDILLKEGKLTNAEFEIMKMHTIIGGNVIAELERKLHFRTFFTLGKEIAYHHHQKFNGKGYPNIFKGDIMLVEEGMGKPLAGEEIPLSARIVALADVYDALVSKRCYKRAFTVEAAADIIVSERGEHFDPDIVDAFLEIQDKFKDVRKRFNR
ncbi:MAG: HD domain-containing phosphohydrolase [Fibrobacterota bacterium]